MSEPVHRIDPERLVWREVDGEVIALDLRGGKYLGLNTSAAILWPLLAEGATAPALAAALAAHYALDREQAAADVTALVAWLRERSLLLPPP